MDTLDDGFGHWLAGFLDGEGSFGIARRRAEANTSLLHYYCFLSVKLRDDDRAILEEIQRRTGVGGIYTNKARGASKTGAQWLVTNKADCLALVAILDAYPLRAKKSRDYAIWRQAVLLWHQQKRGYRHIGTQIDHEQWSSLFSALKSTRNYISKAS